MEIVLFVKIGIFILFILFFVLVRAGLKRINKTANSAEIVIGTIYIFSLVLFVIGMSSH